MKPDNLKVHTVTNYQFNGTRVLYFSVNQLIVQPLNILQDVAQAHGPPGGNPLRSLLHAIICLRCRDNRKLILKAPEVICLWNNPWNAHVSHRKVADTEREITATSEERSLFGWRLASLSRCLRWSEDLPNLLVLLLPPPQSPSTPWTLSALACGKPSDKIKTKWQSI